MIVWQGLGFLAALIPAALLVVLGVLNKSSSLTHGVELALLASAVLVWFIGRRLNSGPDRVLVDPMTNEEVRLKRKHTLFWVPMEWIAIPLAAAALYVLAKTFA